MTWPKKSKEGRSSGGGAELAEVEGNIDARAASQARRYQPAPSFIPHFASTPRDDEPTREIASPSPRDPRSVFLSPLSLSPVRFTRRGRRVGPPPTHFEKLLFSSTLTQRDIPGRRCSYCVPRMHRAFIISQQSARECRVSAAVR